MMKKNKKEVAEQIYKTIDKNLDKLIKNNALKYLKKLKNKHWYIIALDGYVNVSKAMLGLLSAYSKKYAEIIRDKNLFETKTTIKKDNSKKYKKIINKDIRKKLEKINNEFEEELKGFYEEEIKKGVLLLAAEKTAKELGIKYNFNKFNKFTRDYLKDKKINWAKQVARTTEDRVKELLVKGFEEGLGSYDIADTIQADTCFSYARAEMIARTEVISSCNYADFAMWHFDDGIYAKKWSATGDDRTRLEHSIADGQVKKLDEPFIVGGEKLMYPLDSSLGASAENIVNCRCTMFHLTKEEYEKEKGKIF